VARLRQDRAVAEHAQEDPSTRRSRRSRWRRQRPARRPATARTAGRRRSRRRSPATNELPNSSVARVSSSSACEAGSPLLMPPTSRSPRWSAAPRHRSRTVAIALAPACPPAQAGQRLTSLTRLSRPLRDGRSSRGCGFAGPHRARACGGFRDLPGPGLYLVWRARGSNPDSRGVECANVASYA
jgi:hypothetical protein